VFRYTNDAFSLNNCVDRIYPIEPEIKDTTDTDRSISYLDLHLEIDSEGRLRIKFYDKRDDFYIPIVNFPFICSNIPAAPPYGVYISQIIRYSRVCGSYMDVLQKEKQPSTKHTYKAKVRETRNPLKTGVNLGASEGSADPAPLVVPVVLT
jgi:hypothetical protein